MAPLLKNLAEILLLLPLFWGSLAFAGWLIAREQVWIDLGFIALGIGMIALVVALLIWLLRMFFPSLETPRHPWRVPVLAMTDVLAAGVYFSIALSLPIWTSITLENTGSQSVRGLEIDCLERLHRRESLAPGQIYRIQCIPQREGALSISWFNGATRHQVKLGYLTPGLAQHLHFRFNAKGTLDGL